LSGAVSGRLRENDAVFLDNFRQFSQISFVHYRIRKKVESQKFISRQILNFRLRLSTRAL
jgi:hypothetical protein